MATFFVDSSALVKRHIAEIGSTWTRSWIEPQIANTILTCDLTPVEVFSSFARRQRKGTISPAHIALLQRDCLTHIKQEYLSIRLDNVVLDQARDLVTRYTLRSSDAIQCYSVGSSTASKGFTQYFTHLYLCRFICADTAFLTAATVEGFQTDKRNIHL